MVKLAWHAAACVLVLMFAAPVHGQTSRQKALDLVAPIELDGEPVAGFRLTDVQLHPEFVRYLHLNWTEGQKHYPSTGFIALMLALHVCDEVNVFGFGADASGRWDRYYEDDPVDASRFHPGGYEGQLRREMEEKGILKVFRGSRVEPGTGQDRPPQD